MTILSTAAFGAGKQYPPKRDMGRVQKFEKYYRWSQGEFIGQSITPQLRFEETPAPLKLRANFFAVVKEFWADSVGGRPVIEGGNSPREADFLARISSNLAEATALVVGDLIRYGVGVFYSRAPLQIQALDPRFYYPIAPAYDSTLSEGAVVAYPFNDDPDEFDATNNRLYIAEHTRTPQARIAKLDGLTIAETMTKLEQQPFVEGQVVPVAIGEGIFGRSDYIDIAPYIFALAELETNLDEALGRHVDPHLSVPEGSLQLNELGQASLAKSGMVLPQPDGHTVAPSYVNFDPDWGAAHEAIDRYVGRILRLCKISEIFFSSRKFEGLSIPSGAALRRMATMSVQRLQLIQQALTEAYRRVLPAQAALLRDAGGELIPINGDELSVTWPPPFSTGIDEGENIRALRDSGALSQELALQLVENISRREAESKIRQERRENNNADG